MNANDQYANAATDKTKLPVWNRIWECYQEWYQLQSRIRLLVFTSGYIAGVVLFVLLAWLLTHPAHQLGLANCIWFGASELTFYIAWPMIALRWKNSNH